MNLGHFSVDKILTEYCSTINKVSIGKIFSIIFVT